MTLVVAAVLLVAACVALGAARVGAAAAGRARADATADLVALAGALDGATGAQRVASRNGATVVSFRTLPVGSSGPAVVVVVDRSGIRSTAAARPAG